jgi:hypothetical protein
MPQKYLHFKMLNRDEQGFYQNSSEHVFMIVCVTFHSEEILELVKNSVQSFL